MIQRNSSITERIFYPVDVSVTDHLNVLPSRCHNPSILQLLHEFVFSKTTDVKKKKKKKQNKKAEERKRDEELAL